MKRAFFLIIFLHDSISNAAEASAPWLTEADIMEVRSLAAKTPDARTSAEELAQLQWQAKQYQRMLQQNAAAQDGQRHRSAWTASVPDPAASACAAPVKPLRTKHKTHKRERSISEPSDPVDPISPPPFEHFTTEVTDGTLELALKALNEMEENSKELFTNTREALLTAQENHKALLETKINSDLPERKGIKKVLNLFQNEEQRFQQHLNKQTKDRATLQEEAGEAFNVLVAAILYARNTQAKLKERVQAQSVKSGDRQEKLRQRTNSTSGSPRLSMAKPK